MTIQAQGIDRELKTYPSYFEDILEGRKTFEVRNRTQDDGPPRPFLIGERILLREWNPATEYSGREMTILVTYSCALDHIGLLGWDAMTIRVVSPCAS